MKQITPSAASIKTALPYPFPNQYHVHMVGVGGAGMAGIAQLLLEGGVTVSGSDMQTGPSVPALQAKGLTFYEGHTAGQIQHADVVVRSTAIPDSNPEIVAARAADVPVIGRAQMLAELMHLRYNIAIAGTHGKTTTTALVANMLTQAELDPSYVVGGVVKSVGTNAHTGSSNLMVVEADESDGSFLQLHPTIAIVTNIDEDHLCNYNHDFEELKTAFVTFLNRLPFYGLAVVCTDDPIIREILPRITAPVVTYGFDDTAMVRGMRYISHGISGELTYQLPDQNTTQTVTLSIPGQHNALNALASIAVAHHLSLTPDVINQACASFKGVGRRFNLHGEIPFDNGSVLVIDDYGHHPTEVSVTIASAKHAWPDRRLVVVYQPHRYTRLQDLFDEFVTSLEAAETLILLPVYSAGEAPIEGVNTEKLGQALQAKKTLGPIIASVTDALPDILNDTLRAGDVVLMQGAGDINALAEQYVASVKNSC